MVTATFLTEDSYLGEITNPLTLNRYNYTLSNYLNYQDPSGHVADYIVDIAFLIIGFVDLCRNPSWANAGWLALDGILAAVPVIPNVAAARHLGKLNKVGDGINYVKKAVSGAFKAADNVGCEVLEESIEKTVKEAVEEATEKTGKEMLEETAESQLDEAGKALDGSPSGADEMGSIVDDVFARGKEVFDNFDVDTAYVKAKHLSTSGGNGAKFLGDSKEAAETILKNAIKNGTVQSIADNGLTSFGKQSYQIIIEAGETIGTKGETLIKIVLSEDGGMLSAYPIK